MSLNKTYLLIPILYLLTLTTGSAIGIADSIYLEPLDTLHQTDQVNKKNLRRKLPTFLAFKGTAGSVIPTKDFISGDNRISYYNAYSYKFGIASVGDKWEDITFGMPYYGIGIYHAEFYRKKDIGRPVSLFLFQGGTLANISRWVQLNYEWNLGVSMGWKPYDPIRNPDNEVIGSEVNAHVGANIYLKLATISGMDFHFGTEVTHFSNGASRMPNAGMNMASVYFEMSYNFNRRELKNKYDPSLKAPDFEPHYVSEFLINISSRQEKMDTAGTGLPSIYIDRTFKVLGFNYAFLRVPNYRYRYGLSTDFLYDESAGVTAHRIINPDDGKVYDVVRKGKPKNRFSLGVSARGEMMLPRFSIFANMGYDIIHGNEKDHRFYQVIGAKVYLKENFFGTFGIRANHFSRAQFLFWSLGYTLDHSPIQKRYNKTK